MNTIKILKLARECMLAERRYRDAADANHRGLSAVYASLQNCISDLLSCGKDDEASIIEDVAARFREEYERTRTVYKDSILAMDSARLALARAVPWGYRDCYAEVARIAENADDTEVSAWANAALEADYS